MKDTVSTNKATHSKLKVAQIFFLIISVILLLPIACIIVLKGYVYIHYDTLPPCGDFHRAAANGDVTQLEHLLKEKPGLLENPCAERDDNNGELMGVLTPLQCAARSCSLKGVAFLVEKGAKVDSSTDYTHVTPLTMNIIYSTDNTEVPLYLIRHGANVNARNGGVHSETPLLAAVEKNAKQVAVLLLDSGADVNGRGRQEQSPLFVAAQTPDSSEVIKILLSHHADVNAHDYDGDTPLHYAVIREQVTAVSRLLAAGASCNIKNHQGWTPLHFLARTSPISVQDALAICALLKSHGAQLDLKDNDGKTAADLAREGSKTQLLTALQN